MFKYNHIFAGTEETNELRLSRVQQVKVHIAQQLEIYGSLATFLLGSYLVYYATNRVSIAFVSFVFLAVNLVMSVVSRRVEKWQTFVEYSIAVFNVLFVPLAMLFTNDKSPIWMLHLVAIMRMTVVFHSLVVKTLLAISHLLPIPVILLLEGATFEQIVNPTFLMFVFVTIMFGLTSFIERAEEKIEEDELRLRSSSRLIELIVNNIPDGVIVTDRELNTIIWNRAAEKLIGPSQEVTSAHDFISKHGIYHLDQGSMFMPETFPLVKATRGVAANRVRMLIKNKIAASGTIIEASGQPIIDTDDKCRGGLLLFKRVENVAQVETGKIVLPKYAEEPDTHFDETRDFSQDVQAVLSGYFANLIFDRDFNKTKLQSFAVSMQNSAERLLTNMQLMQKFAVIDGSTKNTDISLASLMDDVRVFVATLARSDRFSIDLMLVPENLYIRANYVDLFQAFVIIFTDLLHANNSEFEKRLEVRACDEEGFAVIEVLDVTENVNVLIDETTARLRLASRLITGNQGAVEFSSGKFRVRVVMPAINRSGKADSENSPDFGSGSDGDNEVA